jgi:hypothetical protein
MIWRDRVVRVRGPTFEGKAGEKRGKCGVMIED